MKRLLLLVALLIVLSAPALAEYGAGPMGMGGAYGALAQGAAAIYWNPAGLGFTADWEASVTVSLPKDEPLSMAVAAGPVGNIGIGVGQLKYPYWGGGTNQTVVAAGYRINDRMAVGAGIRFGAADDSIDAAFQYREGLVSIGVMAQDLLNQTGMNLRPAVAVETDKLTVAIEAAYANNFDNVLRLQEAYYDHQAGIEYRPGGKAGRIALRSGFYHGNVTFGAGVGLKRISVDLALIPNWQVAQVTAAVTF